MHTIYCSLCSFSYKELKSHGKCNEKMFPGKLYKEIYIHINVESVGKGQHFGIVSVLVVQVVMTISSCDWDCKQ